jgi:metal-responsive CopG/Arc/MetJ family transcriptional regulator
MKQAIYVKALTVALPQVLYLRIKEVSDERFISMAEVVRQIVEKGLPDYIQREDSGNER